MAEHTKPFLRTATHLDSLQELHNEQQIEVPEGKVRVAITYLEMTSYKPQSVKKKRAENLSIIRAHNPTVSFYRYLYNTVGEKWYWYEQRLKSDDAIQQRICSPKVRIYVMYVYGTPAGFTELNYTVRKEVEIAYFGLVPDFIGRGLGLYFLEWIIETAWLGNPKRVWVHTCDLDHPAAIATYQKVGLSPYRQEFEIIKDPRTYDFFNKH